MITRVTYAAKRLHQQLKVRGTTVTLRRFSTTTGPKPEPNPPHVEDLKLSGNYSVGVTTINLGATKLHGRILVGDKLRIGDDTYEVSVGATAVNNAATVTLSSPLLESFLDGEVVTPVWAADSVIPAMINPFGRHLVDGTLIESSDLQVSISLHSLKGVEPKLTDIVILKSGDARRIVAIMPMMVTGEVAGYTLQTR